MKLDITDTEKKLIITGIQMRRNYIETGEATMSAETAKNCGESRRIKSLSIEQMKLIVDTEQLLSKLYQVPIITASQVLPMRKL